ncbi:MAG: AMP-binding protein [Ferrovibrio sp.]|uniref:AMP-binding protein n=1 Tax=Ferrovibrio sp. TaxID=1917215 RepID=UPI0026166439|nr:AMP-binding protein [Ferrovibrio sp.]MCW0234995.1 AMP-binding protein [Ferrovibrio sp.]
MIRGLMMDEPLLLGSIIEYAGRYHPETEIVARDLAGGIVRDDYAGALDRIRRVANGLLGLGLQFSDRVATLCWNTREHFELFYAVPCTGGILHTVNPRLSDAHIAYIINHGAAEILVCDAGTAEIVARLLPQLGSVRHVIHIGTPVPPASTAPGRVDHLGYDALVADNEPLAAFPRFDEHAAAVLCYTSGTTGNPKGVLYSHRALTLIAIASIAKDFFGGYRNGDMDVYMPIAGMFHATGWSFPYVAPISGGKLVLPGRQHEPEALYELLHGEKVTIAAAVPTVLLGLCDWLESRDRQLPALRSILTSGSAPSRPLIDRWEIGQGVNIVQTWGMTEALCSSRGSLKPGLGTLPQERQLDYKQKSGRVAWGTRLRLVDEAGGELPQDGKAIGLLQARGPWIASGYFGEDSSPLSADGWLNTGDMASIDPEGYIQIRDRAKDIIKSGGEWISTAELEAHSLEYPGVQYAAVIGIPHPKWQERPLLIVQPRDGQDIDKAALLDFLARRVAKWWLPDNVEIVAQMPISATGKIQKAELRRIHAA